MDWPMEVFTGVAVGGAVAGGVALRLWEKLSAKPDPEQPMSERLLTELLAATRANGQTLRHLRDLTAEMQGDHRVIETKLDQLNQREKQA